MGKIFEKVVKVYTSIEHKTYCEFNSPSNGNFLFRNGTKKHPNFEYLNNYDDEDTFVKNYGNPLFTVSVDKFTISVEHNGDKFSIKLYYYNKTRNVGKVYFVKKTKLTFFTYNIRTNSLYDGSLTNYHLKRKCVKRIRRSIMANDPIQKIQDSISHSLVTFHKVNGEFYKLDDASELSNTIINMFIDLIPNTNEYSDIPKYKLYKRYYDYGGVKLPDNWKSFLPIYPQPKKKELKKVGFKYIDCLMMLYNLNGDKIKRILHKVNYCNFSSLLWSFKAFGKEYIMSKTDNEILGILECRSIFDVRINHIDLKKSEKENAYNIFKYVLIGVVDIFTFTDHMVYYDRLRNVNPVKWLSKTHEEFVDEHYEWSDMYSNLSKATYERKYNDDFKSKLECLINDDDKWYTPVLLTSTKDYNMESITQKNCVRTYIDKTKSVIISLREGGVDSLEKLTIEYIIFKNSNDANFTLIRVQTKYKSNNTPSEKWNGVLEKLDNRIKELCSFGFFTLPSANITLPGNKIVNSKIIFVGDNNSGYFEWDTDDCNKHKDFNYFIDNVIDNNYDYINDLPF